MGTDIHIVAQVKDSNGVWQDIPTAGFDICNRNYTWFTFLCGERSYNTNEQRKMGITPIAKPRGAPEGFKVDVSEDPYDPGNSYKGQWMGYGVSSWVTLAEILEHEKNLPDTLYKDCIYRVGPIDELERLFSGHKPEDCRIVFGFDC